MTFGARARIRLSAIRHNLETTRRKAPGTRCMAVIKANAYGHGLIEVARALAGVDCLAVARFAEAERLRSAGIETAIVVLGGPLSAGDVARAAELDCGIAVHDPAQLSWLGQCRRAIPIVWVKVDTGMRRLGFYPEAVADVLGRLGESTASTGLMTHFANADDPGDDSTLKQLDRFLPLLEHFGGQVSIANSAALLSWPATLDRLSDVCADGRLWIRPGLALYGISPHAGATGPGQGLVPAMQFESRLVSVKPLGAGDCVGYGGDWRASENTVLGIVAAGYGDGYSRRIPSGTPVLVNGRRVRVAGRISMDLIAVDLGPEATEAVGDRVVLWGDHLPVEAIAEAAGTIPYTLVTGVTHREPPVYED